MNLLLYFKQYLPLRLQNDRMSAKCTEPFLYYRRNVDFISVGRGKEMSVKSDQKKQITGLLYSVCGGVLFAAGVNLFITPLDLYNGGFMGIAQFDSYLFNFGSASFFRRRYR